MDKFLSWEGWAGVSAIAQILALVTLIAGFVRFLALRRQMPLFQLSWDFIGTYWVDGDEYHLVEFRNVGRGAGELIDLHLTGARVHLREEFIPPTVLGGGQSFRLLLTSADLGKAWFRWVWRTEKNAFRFFVRWDSATRSGETYEQWQRDTERWLWRSYYEMVRDRLRGGYVGPGGAPHGVVSGPNGGDRILATLMGGDLDAVFQQVLLRNGTPRPLPYVPPTAE